MIRKTAVIIGGSSEIGLETAKKFAEKGWNLALTYNKHNIETKFEGVEVKTYQLNLLEKGKIEEVFAKVMHDFKSLNALVFCAGVAQKRAIIFDVKDEEIDSLFEINIKSAIKCVREFTKQTINKNESSVVLVGSFVEKNGCACESVYTATKSAFNGLCKSLANELGNFGIRVNVVAPGFVDTKMNNNLTKAEKDDISDMTPLQRLGKAEDVANAICFLSDENSSFITGQILYVDGGLVLE